MLPLEKRCQKSERNLADLRTKKLAEKGALTDMKLFIGIVPPEEYKQKVLAFQKLWPENRLPARIEPHITVKAPFDPPKNNVWLDELRKLCQTIPSFSVELGPPAYFGERVVYLSVKSEGAISLHQDVIRIFSETTGYRLSRSEGKTYTPHLTLGNIRHGLTSEAIKEMGERAAKELTPYPRFQVEFIRVYQKVNAQTPWTRYTDLMLRK